MFTFYASEDKGLLKEKIDLFKSKNNKFTHLIGCEISDVENLLLQSSLFEDDTNYLIEGYTDKQSLLLKLLQQIDLNQINLCLVYQCQKKEKILPGIIKLINNQDYQLVKLNKNTKDIYVSRLCQGLNLSLTAKQKSFICFKLPKSASQINEFLTNLSLYSDKNTNIINDEVINYFLETIEHDFSFFDFFAHYFLLRKSEWISFFNHKINNCNDLMLFLKSFSYKLTEFLNFLNMRKKFTIKEILLQTGKNYFLFADFENIYKKHFQKKSKYINEFTMNFYFLVNENIEELYKNIALLKHFFLVNSIDIYVK